MIPAAPTDQHPAPHPLAVARNVDEWHEAIAFGVFASGAMRGGATLERCRAMFKDLPLEDRARWLQRGRDTITYALSYVP